MGAVRDARVIPPIDTRLLSLDLNDATRALHLHPNGHISIKGVPDWDGYLNDPMRVVRKAWNALTDVRDGRDRTAAFIGAWRAATTGNGDMAHGRQDCVTPSLRGYAKDACCVHILRKIDRGDGVTKSEISTLASHIKVRAQDMLNVAGFGGALGLYTPHTALFYDDIKSYDRFNRNRHNGAWTLTLGRDWFTEVYLKGRALVRHRDIPSATVPMFVLRPSRGVSYEMGHTAASPEGLFCVRWNADRRTGPRSYGTYETDFYAEDEVSPVPEGEIRKATKHHARGW